MLRGKYMKKMFIRRALTFSFSLPILAVAFFGCTSVEKDPDIRGFTGVLIDNSNPWRGGVIGGVTGSITGATIVEISKRGAVEAASNDQSVEYQSDDGRMYRADVIAITRDGCSRQIQERVWNNRKLVQKQIREIHYYNGSWSY